MFSTLQIGSILIILLALFDDGRGAAALKPSNFTRLTRQRKITINTVTLKFVEKIFEGYGDNRTGKISTEKLQELMVALHLVMDSPNGTSPLKREESGEHAHGGSLIKRSIEAPRAGRGEQEPTRNKRKRRASSGLDYQDAHADEETQECMPLDKILAIHGMNSSGGLSQDDFVNLCPSLIYQIEKHSCQPETHVEEDAHAHEDEEQEQHAAKWKVWTYGVVAITVISLASLGAIAVVPLIGPSIYTRVMSLLVALAVGTLAGDALLHLIPHAFVPIESHDHSEASESSSSQRPVFKACVVVFGIYAFFLVECIMKVRATRRHAPRGLSAHACDNVKLIKKHKGKQEKHHHHMVGSRLAGMQRCHSCDFPATRGEPRDTTAHTVCSETAFLAREERGYEEKEVTSPMSSWDSRENCFQTSVPPKVTQYSFSDSELCATRCDQHSIVFGQPNDNFRFSDSSHSHGNHVHCVHLTEVSRDGSETLKDIDEHVNSHVPGHTHAHSHSHGHGHGHGHGHSHHIDKNASIATVAWMVIVGDGFHNFGDGLAVGAAFAASLDTGLTTAIAVFCHELPHELGDFAVLVRSGFTIKQAMTYNMVSALISYIGLILGIFIGDISSAQGWVLSLTAGMFLYISLVDMLPELNKYISEGGGWSVFICQNVGFLTGTIIMLVIAIYESH